MPGKNEKDLEDIPRRVTREIKVELVDQVDSVLEAVLMEPIEPPASADHEHRADEDEPVDEVAL